MKTAMQQLKETVQLLYLDIRKETLIKWIEQDGLPLERKQLFDAGQEGYKRGYEDASEGLEPMKYDYVKENIE